MDEDHGRRARQGEPLTPVRPRGHRVRSALRAGASAAALLCVAALARGGGEATARSDMERVLVEPQQRRAVDRALAWIAAHQQPGGTWGEQRGTRVADTALSVLALMAGGSTVGSAPPLPDGAPGAETLRGPYARQVHAGIGYLARLAWADVAGKADGYIRDDEASKMHGHGFATLALAQASGNLGGTNLERIRAYVRTGNALSGLCLADQVRWALDRAVACTERAQDPETGGWGYEAQPSGHEGSMTVTQVVALRAAQDAGVRVNGTVMRRAYDYLRQSQVRTSKTDLGGFMYMKSLPERVSYGLTAASLTTLFGLGRYGGEPEDERTIRLGLQYMDRELEPVLSPQSQFFYYNLFYGAQALYLSSDERRIRTEWPKIRAAVLEQQRADGSFRDCGPQQDTGGEEYSTAIACLTLQVPMEALPVFQRR